MNRADDNNNSNSNYSKTMKRRKKKTTEQSKQQAARSRSRSRGCFRGQAHLRNINHNNSNYDRHIQARALTDNNNSNCPAQLAKLFV